MKSEAEVWLEETGFVDQLQWRNSDGDHLVDLLLEEEVYTNEPSGREVIIANDDREEYAVMGYVFEDDSIIAILGDRWVAFDNSWQNDEEELWVDRIR